MNIGLKIISRVFIRSFYLENTSFFLLVIGLAGGFMSDVEHIALGEFFISTPYLLLIPISVWLLYGIKIISFNDSMLKRTENEFLFQFILYPKWYQWVVVWGAVMVQFIPAIIYACFLVLLAAKQGVYKPIALVVVSLIIVCVSICARLMRAFHHANQERKIGLLSRLMNKYLIRPYPFFAIEWISRNQPILLIGTKLVGSLLLFGVLKLYTTDRYDFRLLGMALVIVGAIGAQLIFEIHRFENSHFVIIRQLPISFLKRMVYATLSLSIIQFLEMGLLITHFPVDLSAFTMVEGLVFLISILFFFYSFLYRKISDQEKLMKFVFMFSFIWIVLILFGLPLWILASSNLLIGMFWFNRFYYRFELTVDPD